MDQVNLLIGASSAIPEAVIRQHIGDFHAPPASTIAFTEGNRALRRVISDIFPGATGVKVESAIAARRAMADATHLVLLWDGHDLANLLFEARLQKKKTKLIPISITTIVNKKRTNEYDVYIGRGSPWGNPFAISHGDGPDRNEVIEKYRAFFYERIANDDKFRKGILSLKGLRLACFCKPEACHGDVIAHYLDSEVEQSERPL